VRQAPPVGVTCSGGGLWRAAQVLLAAAAAAAFAAWSLLHAGGPVMAGGLAALLAALVAGTAAWRLASPQATLLRWDGQVWSADGVQGQVDVMLDLQRWLLLRFRPTPGRGLGRTRWLPLPDAEAGAARHGLRAALYSRAWPAEPPSAAL
jgi:hypothetical protein